jgi:hypothetical protein
MKNKKPMIIVLSITGALLLALLIGKLALYFQFNKQVAQLFALSLHPTKKTFSKAQLSGLPEPVQRYFNHVLKDGQPYINYASITHDGEFKTGLDKGWVDIKGEQYATTEKPGFIWKGTTTMFTARDMYIADNGRLTVSLFSLLKVVDAKGNSYNQGELLRWLGESVLYPTNLLPSERLQWFAIDSQSARLTFNYNGMELFFLVSFNAVGEISQLETKRYMDEENLETWIIKMAGYKEMNNVVVPTAFNVLWRLKKGDFSYARFNIKTIVYEHSQKI